MFLFSSKNTVKKRLTMSSPESVSLIVNKDDDRYGKKMNGTVEINKVWMMRAFYLLLKYAKEEGKATKMKKRSLENQR